MAQLKYWNGSDWVEAVVGAQGPTGSPGPGVAAGGTEGQVLTKVNSTDYNTQWSTLDLSTKQDVVSGVSSTEIGYLDGVTSSIQTQLNSKSPIASPTFTGTATTNNLIVDGDFTVNGTNFAASATSITIEDNLIQIAHNNPANTVDLGIVVGYNDGTAKHAGLVKDTSDNYWKLFKDVTTEPTTTVDFTQGSLDNLAVAGFTASSISVGNVSNTEFGYLNGVTSSIQTQLNAKQATINPGIGLAFNTYGGIPYLEIDSTSNINVTGLTVSGSADFTGATVTGLPTTSAATPIAGGTVLGETNSTTNTVALGYNVSPTANEVTLGNSSITKLKVPGIGLVASTTSTLFGAPIKEKVNSLGTVSSGPIAFNILTASVINMVVGTAANFTINFRGSSTVTLNSMLDIDESITVVFIANSAGTYYPNTLQIDGGAGTIVNNRWQGGTAPTAGTGGSADIYTFNIQKVANNLYQMFSSQTKFG